jgi:hypothetical protein
MGIAGRNIMKQPLKKGIKEKISTFMTVCFTKICVFNFLPHTLGSTPPSEVTTITGIGDFLIIFMAVSPKRNS